VETTGGTLPWKTPVGESSTSSSQSYCPHPRPNDCSLHCCLSSSILRPIQHVNSVVQWLPHVRVKSTPVIACGAAHKVLRIFVRDSHCIEPIPSELSPTSLVPRLIYDWGLTSSPASGLGCLSRLSVPQVITEGPPFTALGHSRIALPCLRHSVGSCSSELMKDGSGELGEMNVIFRKMWVMADGRASKNFC